MDDLIETNQNQEKTEEIQFEKNDWGVGLHPNEEEAEEKYEKLKKTDTDPKCDLSFDIIVRFLNKVNDLKGKKKSEFVTKFFEEFLFKRDRRNAFSYLRLILPHLDRERGSYGLKEITLGKLVADAFGLPQSEVQRLRFYKNPSYHPHGAPVGDFVGVLHSVVKDLCKAKSDLTVDDVNKTLDDLSHADSSKKQVEIMTQLMQRCSADDIYWISRIILKDLKIGLRHEKVLPIYHKDALDLYNVTSNLREVCRELADPTKSMGSNIFRLFAPIKPMLAGKKTAEDLRSLLAGTEILIETKFDGERIQCHFNQDDMKFFSRNSNDYTHLYGPKIGQTLRSCLSASAGILDGEIVVLEKGTWNPVQFGMNKTVALNQEEDGDYQLCYMVFDILYVKGPKGEECNLMNVSLKDRKMVLKRVLKPIPHLIEVVTGVETTDIDRVFVEFDNAMLHNDEGIIVKRNQSIYSPNDRGIDWIKLKGEYVEGMIDTLDLLIIGGYFGEGRVRIGYGDWTDHITTFLLGVMKEVDEAHPERSVIIPFTKVGTGYSVDELQELRNKMRTKWKKFDPKNKPGYLTSWNPATIDNPDVFISNPKESIILEVKAAEFIRTNTFASEYTLRFPRVVKIRYDKDWYDGLKENEMHDMIKQVAQNKGLRNLRRKGDDNDSDDEIVNENTNTSQKTSKTGVDKKKFKKSNLEYNVYSQFKDTDTSKIDVMSDLFKNCEFYISNLDDTSVSKSFLEEQIVRHGGTKVQNFRTSNTHVIASILDFRVKAILNKYDCNIYKPEWVVDSIKKGEQQEMAPKYMLYVVPYLRTKIQSFFDKFGDNYFKMSSSDDVRGLLKEVHVNSEELYFDDDMIELKNELKAKLIQDSHPFKDKIFFQIAQDQSADDKFLKAMITAKGGYVKHKLIPETDFIMKSQFNPDQKKAIEKFISQNANAKLVSKRGLFGLI